jgi:hypothetical protein
MRLRFFVAAFALGLAAISAATSLKTPRYGHYYATSGNDNTGSSITTLCGKKGITGINQRMNWGDYEPSEGTYATSNAFDQVLSTISGLGASSGSGGSYKANNACAMWVFITWKAFGPGNPCPSWLKDSNGNPGVAPTNFGTSIVNIAAGATSVTNATPIVITTAAAHGFSTGDTIFIDNVAGNKAANGFWTVTVTGASTFSLNGSHGNGARVQSGTPTGWYGRATKGGAFICKLWDSTVLAKFNTMLAHLGGVYDSNANVEGFQLQESAVSSTGAYVDDATAGGDYTGTKWATSIVSIMQNCSTDFPTSRCMAFLNQIQGNQAGLGTVSAALSALPFNQGCYSGPDILPANAGLVAGTYQYLNAHVGCRADSAQNTTIVGSSSGPQACDPIAHNCNAIFVFSVQGTFGHLNKTVPLPSNQGLCLNSYIFWNDSVAEQAYVDPTVQANPYGIGWYGQCICGGGPP